MKAVPQHSSNTGINTLTYFRGVHRGAFSSKALHTEAKRIISYRSKCCFTRYFTHIYFTMDSENIPHGVAINMDFQEV